MTEYNQQANGVAVNPSKDTPASEIDLLAERDRVAQDNPQLAQSYQEFQASYAKFRETEKQFRGQGSQAANPKMGIRYRT